MKKYNAGIIGCGLTGNKRADVLKKFDNIILKTVCDLDFERAKAIGKKHNCDYAVSWETIMEDDDIGLVFVCTPNDSLARLTQETLAHDKHVFVEKPAGINLDEIKDTIDAYDMIHKSSKIKVGYNHRFHPSIIRAKEIINKEDIGDVMFIDAVYGHGGRLGYEKEWRAKKDGGGELIDQGSHLIDLARYFMGNLKPMWGCTPTMFWDMPVDDNAYMILKSMNGGIANLHASWTHWKNTFLMNIMCQRGQISINGIGGSYGHETLKFYKMKSSMGLPDITGCEWLGEDNSWSLELAEFLKAIEQDREPNGNIYDALEVMKIIEEVKK